MSIKRNLGILPMNASYQFLGYFRDETPGMTCDNCSRPISNCAKLNRYLADGSVRTVIVGEDCADILGSAEISNFNELRDKKASFARGKRFLHKASKILCDTEKGTVKEFNKGTQFHCFFLYSGRTLVLRTDGIFDKDARELVERYIVEKTTWLQ